MISINEYPSELDISFSGDMSECGITKSRVIWRHNGDAREDVVESGVNQFKWSPLLEISPKKEISSSGGPPFILIIFLGTFP